QAAAQDGAVDAFLGHFAQGADVVQRGDAARGDHRDADVLRQAHGGLDVDAREHAVAADIGVDDGLAAVVLELAGQVQHVVAGQFRPAVGGDLAVACVQADDDVAGEGRAGVAEKTGILDRRRADDDVGDAVVQVVFDRVQVADAPADLHGDGFVDGLDDGLDGGAVARLAGDGAVQVNQVQAARALVDPLGGHGGGIFGKHGG